MNQNETEKMSLWARFVRRFILCYIVAPTVDYTPLAELLAHDDSLISSVGNLLPLEDISSYVDARDIAQHLDISEIACEIEAYEIAENVDLADIAQELDLYEIAQNIDVSDVEIDVSEIVENLDYEDISTRIEVSDLHFESIAENIDLNNLAVYVDLDALGLVVFKHLVRAAKLGEESQ